MKFLTSSGTTTPFRDSPAFMHSLPREYPYHRVFTILHLCFHFLPLFFSCPIYLSHATSSTLTPPIFSMFRKPYKPQEPALSNHTNTYNLYNVSFLHMCYHESSLFLFFAAVSLDLCASSFSYNSRILVILVTPLRFSTEMVVEA